MPADSDPASWLHDSASNPPGGFLENATDYTDYHRFKKNRISEIRGVRGYFFVVGMGETIKSKGGADHEQVNEIFAIRGVVDELAPCRGCEGGAGTGGSGSGSFGGTESYGCD
jgi:hypothetical protein